MKGGMLDGRSAKANDVADEWLDEHGEQRRTRLWNGSQAPSGMRPVLSISFALDVEESEEGGEANADQQDNNGTEEHEAAQARPPGRLWTWYALLRGADDDSSRTAGKPVLLSVHTSDVKAQVGRMVSALGLAETTEGRALGFAAAWHDLGKHRQVWQRSIWNTRYPELVLAKSGNRRPPRDLNPYRHEFGSLLELRSPPLAGEWTDLADEVKELVLHFIAAHHGRARPHFPLDESLDPANPGAFAVAVAREVPQRFARLQRRYGRWGLAYLESILRAADAAASANPSATVAENTESAALARAPGGTP
jgi:CRISPR-associated endonuclease/helicase Cas3